MTTFQKKKRCYFFCYEGAIEGKNVRKSLKSQNGSNMEQYGEYSKLVQEYYFSCAYILLILTGCHVHVFSFVQIAVAVMSLKLFSNVLNHFINVDGNNES